MILEAFGYFVSTFLAMIISWFIGRLIIGLIPLKSMSNYKSFISFIVGLIVLLVLYSTIKTGGKTINIWLIFVFVFLYINYKPKIILDKIRLSEFKKVLILSAVVLLPIFAYQCYFYFDFGNNTYKVLHADHYFYAKMVSSLNVYGTENTSDAIVFIKDKSSIGLNPYHYSELWIAALFAKLFNISSVAAYFLIAIPLFVSIYTIGIYTLLKNAINNKYFRYTVSLLCLFVGGIYFSVYNNFELTNYLNNSDNSILSLFSQKLSLIYVLVLLAFVLYNKGEKFLSYIVFIIIPVFSISFLPAIYGGLLLMNVFDLIKNKFNVTKEIGINTLLIVSSITFFTLFYLIFKSNFSVEKVTSEFFLQKVIHGNIVITDLKVFIGNNIYRLLRAFIYYGPFLILIFAIKKPNKLFSLICLFLFCGVLASSLMYQISNSGQFASNVYIMLSVYVVLNLTEFRCFGNLLKKSIAYTLFVTIIAYSAVISFTEKDKGINKLSLDKTILKNVASDLKQNTIIPFFINKKEFNSMPSFEWLFTKNEMYPLMQFTNKNIFFILATMEMSEENPNIDRKWIKNTPFNQMEFLKMTNNLSVKYVYVKKGSVGLKYVDGLIENQYVLNSMGDVIVKLKKHD